MKDATDKLITVKIRVDGGSNDGFNDPLIEIFNETQPDAVIVHGRRTDEYSQEPYYDQKNILRGTRHACCGQWRCCVF